MVISSTCYITCPSAIEKEDGGEEHDLLNLVVFSVTVHG